MTRGRLHGELHGRPFCGISAAGALVVERVADVTCRECRALLVFVLSGGGVDYETTVETVVTEFYRGEMRKGMN